MCALRALLLPQVQTAARIKKLLERRARLTTAELAMHTRCIPCLCLHRHFAHLAVRGDSPAGRHACCRQGISWCRIWLKQENIAAVRPSGSYPHGTPDTFRDGRRGARRPAAHMDCARKRPTTPWKAHRVIFPGCGKVMDAKVAALRAGEDLTRSWL